MQHAWESVQGVVKMGEAWVSSLRCNVLLSAL
jgi:hypothetical protein